MTETACVTTLISKLSVYSENCLQCPLPKVREALSIQICAKKKRNGPPSANQAFLQPTTAAAMCTAIHDPCLNPFTSPYCLCRTYLHSALLQGMLKSADQSLLVKELKHSHYFVINLLHVLWEYVSGTSYRSVHDLYQVTHEYAMRLECVTI